MKKQLKNKTLQPCEFALIFYTSDGNQYNEVGQTVLTMQQTIADYLADYELSDIEMVLANGRSREVIPLYVDLPF